MSLLGRFFGKQQPEYNSGIPIEVPAGQRPLTMAEMVKRYIREEVSKAAAAEDFDTFDESDDFDEEDPETIPLTHHQVIAMDARELRDVALVDYGIDLVDDPPPTPPRGRRLCGGTVRLPRRPKGEQPRGACLTPPFFLANLGSGAGLVPAPFFVVVVITRCQLLTGIPGHQ